MRATIPAQIPSTNCKIETEIVKADIPLLLSKASLKKAGTVLDLKNDRAIMFNKPLKIKLTSSGHYCVNIVKTKPEIQNVNVNIEQNVLNITDDMSVKQRNSNGFLERHNQTLTYTLLKLKAVNNFDLDIALIWALMAKNAVNNEHGYCPYQLVYGRNPNLPSVLTDKLPAHEGTTMSEIVGKHIQTLHSARTAFTRSECSKRIHRALRKQTRPGGIIYQTGDKVYYKRPDKKEWKGPGHVIGQDGAVVFVRHVGMLVRVHQCRLTKVSTIPETEENKNTGDFE
ncbi:unnamed protein product [Mytilus edulis]|uniref:Integrase catalytic domain-containing protein n=1 Tax=Mytilus edulis TaxID=6550 RepID=A0A8S3QGH0_MYTED|nr:unnamed protein product [Mytilus edulis]